MSAAINENRDEDELENDEDELEEESEHEDSDDDGEYDDDSEDSDDDNSEDSDDDDSEESDDEEYEDDDSEDSDDDEYEDDDSEDDDSEDDDEYEEGDEEDDSAPNEADIQAAAAAAVAKASASARRKKKTGRKKRAPKTTAGQRLAAAKAAKAARKAAERGREAEVVEDAAAEQAEAMGSMLEENRQQILMTIVAILVIAAGYFGYQHVQEGAAAEASNSLWDAVSTANAAIVPEDDEAPEEENPREQYPTFEARAEAALEKFRAVRTDHPGTEAAIYAALGEGGALYETGEYADARAAYEQALAEGGTNSDVAARAIEGIAFTYEAEDDWDQAAEQYESLDALGTDQAEALATLHRVRRSLHADDEEAAKTRLQTLLESLSAEDAPELPYVRDQAELRLMAIDSSLVQRRAPDLGGLGGLGGAGGDFGGRSPEELQRMIQELMQKQGGQAPQ